MKEMIVQQPCLAIRLNPIYAHDFVKQLITATLALINVAIISFDLSLFAR